MATFAQRLTLLRESKNLRKKDLASVLNVSPACVSQYEKSLSMPGHDILIRIAQYFHVSVDFLIGNDYQEKSFDLRNTFYNNISYYDLLNSCSQLSDQYRKILLAMIEAAASEPDNRETGT